MTMSSSTGNVALKEQNGEKTLSKQFGRFADALY